MKVGPCCQMIQKVGYECASTLPNCQYKPRNIGNDNREIEDHGENSSNSITNLIKYTGTLLAISLSDIIWLLHVTILAIHLPRDLQLKEF